MVPAIVHQAALRVLSSHPALPGHFPSRPVVPGVVLLDLILEEAERWLGHALSPGSLPHVKFASALLPEQQAQLELRLDGSELRFDVRRDGELVAHGAFILGPPRS